MYFIFLFLLKDNNFCCIFLDLSNTTVHNELPRLIQGFNASVTFLYMQENNAYLLRNSIKFTKTSMHMIVGRQTISFENHILLPEHLLPSPKPIFSNLDTSI